MDRFTGRTVVVTGGGGGIGGASCRRFGAEGARVAVLDVNLETAQATAAAVNAAGGTAAAFRCDITDRASVDAAVAGVRSELGPIDVLVNNAGITRDGFFHKMSHEQWSEVIRVNMDSCFNMTRQVIEGMRTRGWGRIINISSINGQKGQAGQVNYSAAKAGMIGFTKALAQEGASKGITVNCVAPGYIDTDMVAAVPEDVLKKIIGGIPVGRLGKAEEIASAVSFLASEGSGFMTGSTLTMNGAQYIT